jgi:hypothetical protein
MVWRGSVRIALAYVGGELADESDEVFVVGVASSFEPKHCGSVLRHPVVVGEELTCGWVEVHEHLRDHGANRS